MIILYDIKRCNKFQRLCKQTIWRIGKEWKARLRGATSANGVLPWPLDDDLQSLSCSTNF